MSKPTAARTPRRSPMLRFGVPVIAGLICMAIGAGSVPAISAITETNTEASAVPAVPEGFQEYKKTPKPAVGEPFIADFGSGNEAAIVILGAERVDGKYAAEQFTGDLLLVDVQWETKSGTTEIELDNWTVTAEDGTSTGYFPYANGELKEGPVEAGTGQGGYIAFDIPEGPSTLELIGSNGLEVATIQVDG